jgi:AcrR family transcriptional regulator
MNTSMTSPTSRSSERERDTRERILSIAAELFATHGYHATTTRQIAAAVGIRQPSLFHHFRTKAAMVAALYEWDLGRSEPRARAIARSGDAAAVRLYRYLRADIEHLISADYDLSGIYGPDVIGIPEFAPWAGRVKAVLDLVEGMVREGVNSGEFVPVEPALAREAIHGILDRVLFIHDSLAVRPPRLPDELTFLLVRGLLADPARIVEVRAAATEASPHTE